MKTELLIMEAGTNPTMYYTNRIRVYDSNEREKYSFKSKDGMMLVMRSPKGVKPYSSLVRMTADDETPDVWVSAAFVPEGYKYEIVVS